MVGMCDHILRRACGICAFAALILLAPATASAAETLTVGKAGQNVFAFSLLEVGVKAGLFAKQGLNLEITDFASGPRLHQAMAADSLDIGLGGGTDFVALSKGAPEERSALCPGRPTISALRCRRMGRSAPLPISRRERIGVTTLTSLTAWMTGELSLRQGWGRDGINPNGGRRQHYLGGAAAPPREIDGFTADLGVALQVEQLKAGRLLLQFGDVIKTSTPS